MFFKGLVATAVLAIALVGLGSEAAAFGGGGGGRGGRPVSGTFDGYTYTGSCSHGECSGTFQPGNGRWSARIQTSEPLAGLFVGLGLLGARFLRRR
ncbi:MAG TPA: hypothetical protein VNK50_11895 [Calidithermus sp.]|jgi:hypothetical protein|nr:hypothetical protein [Calidithermus sp.]